MSYVYKQLVMAMYIIIVYGYYNNEYTCRSCTMSQRYPWNRSDIQTHISIL